MRLAPIAVLAAVLAVPASAAEDLRIGALLSVTGPAAFLGAPEARTLEMLAEQVNARGGVAGHKVKLIVKDTGASPEKAVSFARQLIDEEKVFAILGPSTSGETMAVKGIAEEARTLLISLAAAEVIVNPVASHVFKTAQKDSHAATLIFQDMKRRASPGWPSSPPTPASARPARSRWRSSPPSTASRSCSTRSTTSRPRTSPPRRPS